MFRRSTGMTGREKEEKPVREGDREGENERDEDKEGRHLREEVEK